MLYSGRKMFAQEALAYGLVNKVAPAGHVLEEAEKMAACILKNWPGAVSWTKRSVNYGLNHGLSLGLRYENNAFGACFEDEAHEGLAAFLERTKK